MFKDQMAKEATLQMDHLLSDIKQKEARMQKIRELRTHIINYSKTRDTYAAYRKAGYSRKFFEAHRQEITLHKAAKEAFDQLELKKIPRIVELNEEFILLAKEKNAEYAQYRTEWERMRNLANAKRNAEMILKRQGENAESKDRTQTKRSKTC
ncbi:MAG: hypothetical protein PUA69_03910 [Erysipelotrichaceae bacterium]|nr:hypothetical protein [Erysipelotrichaceae bacterium]